MKLGRTRAELVAGLSHAEYILWTRYMAREAQARELEHLKAAR